MEVNKQLEQINNFRLSPIFSKITKLPKDEFKELETRVNAFLQMNACNQNRKTKTYWYIFYRKGIFIQFLQFLHPNDFNCIY